MTAFELNPSVELPDTVVPLDAFDLFLILASTIAPGFKFESWFWEENKNNNNNYIYIYIYLYIL